MNSTLVKFKSMRNREIQVKRTKKITIIEKNPGMSEENCNDATTFLLKKYIYMPPQKSLIAELLGKQAKVEQTKYESSVDPRALESSYYNLDLQDNVQLSQSIITTFSNISDQFPISAENTQKTTFDFSDSLTNYRHNSHESNTCQSPLNSTKTFHSLPKLSDSSSAELPTGSPHDSLHSHDALEIFAWNHKKKSKNPDEASELGTTSEYCYYLNDY
ncbi:unnamed protein product [Litomosoides sigmodontis]|uniref:Uncharacterized protein n=1 Tax=Litomosoides sigmodontis TaxID=42156 RepID=A0A3P6UIB5_LITSI|nr:unnamed protein product [Litomosoides sigmodontis]